MKSHPTIGDRLIRDINRLGDDVAQGPASTTKSSTAAATPKACGKFRFNGQLIGIVDCYEALTNEDRPYPPRHGPPGDVEASQARRRGRQVRPGPVRKILLQPDLTRSAAAAPA